MLKKLHQLLHKYSNFLILFFYIGNRKREIYFLKSIFSRMVRGLELFLVIVKGLNIIFKLQKKIILLNCKFLMFQIVSGRRLSKIELVFEL